jgi:hypothetical protein
MLRSGCGSSICRRTLDSTWYARGFRGGFHRANSSLTGSGPSSGTQAASNQTIICW